MLKILKVVVDRSRGREIKFLVVVVRLSRGCDNKCQRDYVTKDIGIQHKTIDDMSQMKEESGVQTERFGKEYFKKMGAA